MQWENPCKFNADKLHYLTVKFGDEHISESYWVLAPLI